MPMLQWGILYSILSYVHVMNGPSSVCGVLGQIQGLRMPSRALSWKVFTLEYHHAVSLLLANIISTHS